MKRTIVAFIAGAVLATAGSVYAEDIQTLIGKQIQGEIPVKVNGETLEKKAIYVDGTSYLPVRAIGDALNMDVKFNAEMGVELIPKEGVTVQSSPVTETEQPTEPVQMSQDDIDAIKSSEEQITISEQKIIEYTDKLKSLNEELEKAELKVSQTTDTYEKQLAGMDVSSIKQTIEGTNQLLKAAKDNIPAQQAYINKIKAKYE